MNVPNFFGSHDLRIPLMEGRNAVWHNAVNALYCRALSFAAAFACQQPFPLVPCLIWETAIKGSGGGGHQMMDVSSNGHSGSKHETVPERRSTKSGE